MNSVKSALASGQVSLGSWIQLGHPGIAEVLANAGFHWIAVDLEHTDISINEFAALCRGMHGRGAVPLARVTENDVLPIRQVLDIGAEGVIVPLVSNANDAARAVAAAKYPPDGIRGFSFTRGNQYGTEFDSYVRDANGDVLVIAMVETREAVENIDAMLAVDGLDGIFVGPYDLSGSYGIPGQLDAPIMKSAFERCVDACRAAGKPAGIHVVTPTSEAISDAIEAGFTFIALGIDHAFLDAGARAALRTAQNVCCKER